MTVKEFQEQIKAGIPDVLPAPKPYDPTINHAPKRKEIPPRRSACWPSAMPCATSRPSTTKCWPASSPRSCTSTSYLYVSFPSRL